MILQYINLKLQLAFKVGYYFLMAKQKQLFTYNNNYLNLGFTSLEVNVEVRQQCMLCLQALAHSSLKETKQ